MFGNLRFDNQIEIEGVVEGKPFSDGGDSGALVIDRDVRAIGLLFAGGESGEGWALV
jgi:cytoskeletal protein CcmA (bactofilin family)